MESDVSNIESAIEKGKRYKEARLTTIVLNVKGGVFKAIRGRD